MSWAEELARLRAAAPGLAHIDLFAFDAQGRAFGKRIPAAEADALADGVRLSPANLVYDSRGTDHAIPGVGAADGDPDAVMRPVQGTLAPAPWIGPHAAQALGALATADGRPVAYDPRARLAGRLAAFTAATGLTPVVACEYEFHLVSDGEPLAPAPNPRTGRRPRAGGSLWVEKVDDYSPFLDAFLAAAAAQGLPCGAVTAEYAPAQFEVNLAHVADAVRAADLALLQRRCAQGVARAQGLDACFMAKPFLDQAGSGLHLHLSLVDSAGRNVFSPETAAAEGLRAVDCGGLAVSERLIHAIGGLSHTLLDHMLAFAPTLNSYRRFQAGVFAPTSATWGLDNRSVAFRIPRQGGAATRVEHRVAGADANPYLALLGVLDGLEAGLAGRLDPGPISTGDVSRQVDPGFPQHFWHALDRFRTSGRARDAYGGLRDIYAALREAEARALLADTIAAEQAWRA